MALLIFGSLLATFVFDLLVAVLISTLTPYDFYTNLIVSNAFGLSFWGWSVFWSLLYQKKAPYRIIVLSFIFGLSQGIALVATLYPQITQWESVITGGFFGLLAFTISILIFSQQQAKLRLKEQQLALQQARMSQLQSQIEPHFLFNTLAHVQAYIHTNPAQANELLNHLTQLMRVSLKRTKEDNPLLIVPLSEEISALQHYLAIQSMRLGARLQINWQVEDICLAQAVPPLLLQPLVENAIVHGIEPLAEGGQLSINIHCDAHGLHIEISDTGMGMEKDTPLGLGLTNLQQRLAFHYGDRANLIATNRPSGGVIVCVSIPLN
jgi:sensor histidine kinase YesM